MTKILYGNAFSIAISQNANCSRDIYLQLLPSIIQINAKSRVSLVKINARFSRREYDNLKKAEHQNNELFVYCFRFCLAYSHLKSKFTACPRKKGRENKNWL